MGYPAQFIGADFCLRGDHSLDALHALQAYCQAPGDRFIGAWTVQTVRHAPHIQDALQAWGWTLVYDEGSGDFTGLEYEAKKLSSDQAAFNAIAPYVTPGSWIEMCGEDGEYWRWYFNGATVERHAGVITYPTMPT